MKLLKKNKLKKTYQSKAPTTESIDASFIWS